MNNANFNNTSLESASDKQKFQKPKRKHLFGNGSDVIQPYLALCAEVGAENVISNEGQRFQLLLKGVINSHLIKTSIKSKNPVIEAYYGYAFRDYRNSTPWTDEHYKVWVKFVDTPHMLRIKFEATFTDKLKDSNGVLTTETKYTLQKIDISQIVPGTLETLNRVKAQLISPI